MKINFTLLEDWIDHILMLTFKKIKNISKTIAQNCIRRQRHQQKHCMDPVYILPIEILNEIFILLPQDTKITLYLDVSKLWSETILKCPSVWREIEIQEDNRVIKSCYDIGFHVKHITINSTFKEIFFSSIQQLKEGHFKQIQLLKITVPEIENPKKYIQLTTTALYQIRDTLTSFTIDTNKTGKYISIADILSLCNNLIELDYSTSTRLSKGRTINNYYTQYQEVPHHHSLINLQLKAPLINKHDIDPLLEQCTELRRLVMNGCTTSVLNTIVDKQQQLNETPLNLEILGYNANSKSMPVPQLPKETMTMIRKAKENKIRGLRILFTNSNGQPVHIQRMLPLLYQNRKTLVYIMAHLSPLDQSELVQLYTRYPNFEFPNISRFTFWSVAGIQEFMLQAIRNSTRLSVLDIIHAYDIDTVLKTLMTMPPLKHLTILYSTASIPETYNDDSFDTTVATTSLISLFKRYVYLSASSPSTFYSLSSSLSAASFSSFSSITSTKTITTATMIPAPSRQFLSTTPSLSLKSITLGKFNTISDRELSILGNIKTLEQITLLDLNNVTTNGIKNLINKLGNQLKYVRLSRMESVTDDIFLNLGDMNGLIRIALDYLPKVTNRGLRLLIDKLYYKLPQQVELSVFYCPLITQKCIRYGKQKIKKFKATPCL